MRWSWSPASGSEASQRRREKPCVWTPRLLALAGLQPDVTPVFVRRGAGISRLNRPVRKILGENLVRVFTNVWK